jgi:hypothetical protein
VIWSGVVVRVDFFAVLPLLLVLVIVMAMRQLVVVMFVGMPGGTMFPFSCQARLMMMGYMIMIVAVDGGWMRMLRRLSLPFDLLLRHE